MRSISGRQGRVLVALCFIGEQVFRSGSLRKSSRIVDRSEAYQTI
jgi:hypothetical protein